MSTRSRGFSLIELMVAVTLVAIVFAGVLMLQDSMLSDKGRVLRQIAVRNQADYARRLMMRELEEATVIEWPAPGSGADEIFGFKNLDRAGGGSPLNCQACPGAPYNGRILCRPAPDPCKPEDQFTAPEKQNFISLVDLNGNGLTSFGDDSSYFRFCWTPDQQLMYYHGPLNKSPTDVNYPPSTPCGTPKPNPSPGETMEAIAGLPAGSVQVVREPASPAALFTRPADQMGLLELEFAVVSTGTISGGVLDTAKADVETRALALLPAR